MKNYGENFQKQFAFVSENFIKICQEMTCIYIVVLYEIYRENEKYH